MENTFGMNIIPDNDPQRLEVLKRYRILDTPPEDSFDHIAQLATQMFRVPIALVSLVDRENVFFKANAGMGKARITGRGISLCSLAVLKQEVTVFEDATKELCLKANPLVAGEFGLRFYAGAPLITHDGYEIGTLCIVDKQPRPFSEKEGLLLQGLAKIVMDSMELRLAALLELQKRDEITEEMATTNEELSSSNKELSGVIEELARTNQELTEAQTALQDLNLQLSERDARFRGLVKEAPVAIFVLKGPGMVFDTVNDLMYRMLGKGEEIIGKSYADAVPELIGQPFFELLDHVYRSGETFYGNEIKGTLLVDGKATDGYFNFIYQPIRDNEGTISGIMCVAVDVIGQVKSRKVIERAEESLRIATESGDLGTWFYQSDTNHFVTSPRFNNILGFPEDEQPAYDSVIAKIAKEDLERVEEAIQASAKEGREFYVEYRSLAREGAVRWIRSVGKQVLDDSGGSYITGVIADITDQKQEEQRKNDFIGIVSHELKTPLTSMSAYIQLLKIKAGKDNDEFAIKTLEKANKQVSKMAKMVNGFLDVTRLEAGAIRIDKQRFDMADLVKEAEEETWATITTHQVIFAPVEPTPVFADRDKIGQVITNLINNAVKYSKPGSIINVACVTVDNCAEVSVKDKGMGIPASDIPKLFDRFYRVEGSHMVGVTGFGIGLYLCAEIIKRHQGVIWVESVPGQGSTFTFNLPVEKEKP